MPASLALTNAGLSPHARGNRGHGVAPNAIKGSIPACAGEPAAPSAACLPAGVYPRMRGGTLGKQGNPLDRGGLSPHARGNPER